MELIKSKQDWKKISLITALFLTVMFGVILSTITGNVLFVKRIGADFLPYTYIAKAILALLVALFLGTKINKFDTSKATKITIIMGVLIYGSIYFLIEKNINSGYWILQILGSIYYSILSGIFLWEITTKITSPFEAKKNLGYFSVGASTGGILAGVASSSLGGLMGTNFLILPIIGSLIISIILVFILKNKYSEKLESLETIEAEQKENGKKSIFTEIKENLDYLKKSKLLKLISVLLILFGIIDLLVDFELQKILGDTFEEDKFSQIIGFISIGENALMIVIYLAAQKWILTRLGVMRALICAPLIILIPFSILFFLPIYQVVISLKLSETMSWRSFFTSPLRFVYSAVPDKYRSKIITLVSSGTSAIGTLIAGLGIVVMTTYLSNQWIIGIGVGLTALAIIIVVLIKKAYINQIIDNLESTNLKDLHTTIENFAEPAYHEVGVIELMKIMENKKLEAETIRKIIFALGKIDNVKVIPRLLDIFEESDITIKYSVIEAIHGFSHLNRDLHPYPFTQMNILDTYKEIFMQEEDPNLKVFILENLKNYNERAVINFIKDNIKSENISVKSQAIKAMRYFNDRGIIKYIKPFLKDENITLKASAIITLWQFIEMRPKLLQEFIPIISTDDKNNILTSLYIISKLHFTWELHFVLKQLESKDQDISTMAALTLTQIDDTRGLAIVIKTLAKGEKHSNIIARNIKSLSPKMKALYFKRFKKLNEKSIKTVIATLKNTYLNFTEEIKEIEDEKKHLKSLH